MFSEKTAKHFDDEADPERNLSVVLLESASIDELGRLEENLPLTVKLIPETRIGRHKC